MKMINTCKKSAVALTLMWGSAFSSSSDSGSWSSPSGNSWCAHRNRAYEEQMKNRKTSPVQTKPEKVSEYNPAQDPNRLVTCDFEALRQELLTQKPQQVAKAAAMEKQLLGSLDSSDQEEGPFLPKAPKAEIRIPEMDFARTMELGTEAVFGTNDAFDTTAVKDHETKRKKYVIDMEIMSAKGESIKTITLNPKHPLSFGEDTLTIGRNYQQCKKLKLNHMSLSHMCFFSKASNPDDLFFKDCGSTNGTYIVDDKLVRRKMTLSNILNKKTGKRESKAYSISQLKLKNRRIAVKYRDAKKENGLILFHVREVNQSEA